MGKKISAIIMGAVLVLSFAGCGTVHKDNDSQSAKDTSMENMPMGKKALPKAFEDELNGFKTIEKDVKKKDFKSATSVANNLHNVFHMHIVPPLKEKKGAAYAEEIHGKYDELQDAVKSQNPSEITKLIKINRENLVKVAKILGVSLNKNE
ncbi:hypothetical protein ACFP7A_06275 [Sporolactobacillus kofuensis]|uniref:Lipoprotein n=1 Tax=Sporolactobacillus kofuensis TaxID=269672 RepID=A0ABW1WC75_9BACL|nr:hypothetical protein [Sporolactobacillus kofuensis]MCO7175489.1 hypothetical protein [Sporolactobacillus kofuensis]